MARKLIDDNLLNSYLGELEALRTHGKEFAQSHPDIASRLDIGSRRSRDPQVERVVESSAFLAARLRMMIERSGAELPASLLSMLAPTLLEPVPSMALVELRSGSEAQAVPRGTRFDYRVGGHALVCMNTTMDVTAVPLALRLRRFKPATPYRDGISLQLAGTPPAQLLLCLGNDELTAALLMDAFVDDLMLIELIQPGAGESIRLSPKRLRIHGFAPDEASLPDRPASHSAHRVVTEFMVFPEKFRFVSLSGLPLKNGSEIRFSFSQPLRLPPALADDLITVNRVPAVNLWPTAATPFDVNGRQLEYRIRVDTQRYRILECHSVERVDMYGPEGGEPMRLDPVVGLGDIHDSAIQWGTRRAVSRAGGEVMLYFKGLDYKALGEHRFLALPHVLANNRDLPQSARVGSRLHPVESLGDWRCVLATVPTAYRPTLVDSRAMRVLTGYLQSSVHGIASAAREHALTNYLKLFPGGGEASWPNAIGGITTEPILSVRGGIPQPATNIQVAFDGTRSPTSSQAMVRRVLAELFESQRRLNTVEEVTVVEG